MSKNKTPEHVAAAQLFKIVANDGMEALEDIDLQIRAQVIDIEREFPENERFEVLRSFFGQVSMSAIVPLYVCNACFYLERLNTPSVGFPLGKCNNIFLGEAGADGLRKFLDTLHATQ